MIIQSMTKIDRIVEEKFIIYFAYPKKSSILILFSNILTNYIHNNKIFTIPCCLTKIRKDT